MKTIRMKGYQDFDIVGYAWDNVEKPVGVIQIIHGMQERVMLKVLLWVMAFVWCQMLHIEYGKAVILLVPIIYFLRNKRMIMIFAGCIAMTLCGFLDVSADTSSYIRTASYIASAPVAFIILHFYNGERGEANRYVNYLAYPVILLAIGLLAKFAF